MTRVKGIGWAIAVLVFAANGVAAAQPADVIFEYASAADESRLTARDRQGAVVDKRLTREGLEIALRAGSDRVQVIAAADGVISVLRGGARVLVKPSSAPAEYEEQVRRLVRGSAAVAGLERLVKALRDSKRAEALSVVATHALVRALQGDDSGRALLIERSPRRQASGMVTVAQRTRYDDTTSDCWAEYEMTLSRSFDRYSQCLRDYWWAQPIQYACGLEWAMVAELALFRLISCVGGFPLS